MDEARVPPITQVGTEPEKDDFVPVSLCVIVSSPRLVAWTAPVAHKSRNDRLKLNHGRSECLHRPVIFEMKGLKSNFHTPAVACERGICSPTTPPP